MATRIFCDHCGNTIRDPIVFCFGPHKAVQDQIDSYRHMHAASQGIQYAYAAQQATLGGGGYGLSQPAQAAPPLPPTISTLEKIDLCQHCVPTWMSRVRNLTKESDA